MKCLLRVTSPFVFCFFFFYSYYAVSQKLTAVQKKALFILEFAHEFNWPKHTTSKDFKIGVLGNNPEIFEALIENSQHGLVKFKPIRIVHYKSIEQIEQPQMLYINGNNKFDVHAVFRKIKGNGTLLVSENLEDFNFSMINFIDDEGDLIYSVNKAVLKQEGFTPSEKIMEFAIVKESEWKSAFEKIQEHNLINSSNITLSKNEINEITNTNKQYLTEINSQRKRIEEQLENIKDQSERIKLQEANLQLLNEEIKLKQQSLINQEIALENYEKEIALKQEKIAKQNKALQNQSAIVKAQTYLIANQKKALAVTIGIMVTILVLLILVVRLNFLRKAANKQLSLQNILLSEQKDKLQKQHQQITDSLHYAQLIQNAILPSYQFIENLFPEHFIFSKPRDIVGGDFYWCYQKDHEIIFITADCTGHGVPGGFMSMLGNSLLNEIVVENNITEPAQILNTLRKKIISNLKQNSTTVGNKDGMDLVCLKINTLSLDLHYSCANNPFWVVRNNIPHEFLPQKMPVGFYAQMDDFTQHYFKLEKNDCIYTFSDGFADQFGGPKGKKFKYKPLQQLLATNAHKPFSEQQKIISETFTKWKENYEQVDDVLLIGIRV